ncbi:C1 family peptidase [Oryzisolibacter sp. LB2S]|uniref:C1 family peptidase n=1 Tax=Alicycliphilus soli TaxID=3228789 RepID=UPI0034584AE3
MPTYLLRQGSQDPLVTRLRKALTVELGSAAGGYPDLNKGGTSFDATLDAALRFWQNGRGLIADGIVGPSNMLALGLADWPRLDCKLDVDSVHALFPATKPVNIARYLHYVTAALRALNLTGRDMVLAALGTIRAETEGFVPISEFQSKYNTAPGGAPFALYDGKLGNRRGEGAMFRGRGFVQLTGRVNYETYGAKLGIDLTAAPDLANAPEVAALLLALFLDAHKGAMQACLDKGDLKGARRLVNGGSHGLDRFQSVFALAQQALPAAAAVPAARAGKRVVAAAARRKAPAEEVPERQLNATADAPDLRDRPYIPPPISLDPEWPRADVVSKWLPAYAKAGLVLNQGREGACTGFGLAGVVNYLRWVRSGSPKTMESVSPRMFYNMARRYDEYAGENYEGSSCRGAIKGWFNHGVCLEEDWPYQATAQKPPRFGYAERARGTTVGVYYRIDTKSISDLQAAIMNVGAIYVSSYVHDGWQQVPTSSLPKNHASLPVIAFDGVPSRDAGHAYAFVGYNERGFVLQNSWGPDWGAHGFAVLSYEDWLQHAMDAWVVALGVPGLIGGGRNVPQAAAGRAATGRGWSESQTLDHVISVGNDGRMSRYLTTDERTRNLSYQVSVLPDQWFRTQAPQGKKRLLIYVHGGLNSEADGLKRARALGRLCEANGCYPLFVVWHTGLLESIGYYLEDWRAGRPAAAGIKEWLTERTDALIESTIGRTVVRALWSEMKENAGYAWQATRAGDLLARALGELKALWGDELEIHLMGHSAGSIWLGHMLTWLAKVQATPGAPSLRESVAGIHLYAPACTVDFANRHFADKALLAKTHIAVLSDSRERDDNTAYIYRKSLLYLVSNALEQDRRTPLLGLERALTGENDQSSWDGASTTGETLSIWRRAAAEARLKSRLTVVKDDRVLTAEPDVRIPASHGAFDNDLAIVGASLAQICGQPLPEPPRDLRGY